MLPWLKKGPQQPAAELETQEISLFFFLLQSLRAWSKKLCFLHRD